MKKLFSCILIFALGIATAAGAIFSPRASVYAADEEVPMSATTEIFLPTTYLQYYKLESPYAICREEIDGKEFVAISHKGAIVLYSDGKFKEITVQGVAAVEGVPSLQLYKQEFLLFSTGSRLWTLNAKTYEVTETNISGNYLSVYEDRLAAATNTDINFYDLSVVDGKLAITRSDDVAMVAGVNELSAFMLASETTGYFFRSGIIKYFDATQKKRRR